MFGSTGYGEQFQDLAQGQPVIVPVQKRKLQLYTLIALGLLVVAGWLGSQGVATWIESGRPQHSVFIGAVAVIGGVEMLIRTLRLLVRPRRLVLSRERFAEQELRHGSWSEVFDVAWEDVQSVTVEVREFRLIRLPGTVCCTLTEAAARAIPDPPGQPIRLSFGYGTPRRLADLLDSARFGLVG
ncbi:hypothetical protein [Microlunatus parietis]|uniref:Uncharacterized protein n=1 Tax=Microlunatus parietis TaxID=682979 RepID=A0A7Y9I4T2_9ACTN|nr:hypothetical protein [Microlunatus parietis]NYE70286.1 hypothetical protein [Microlunatus parietis]